MAQRTFRIGLVGGGQPEVWGARAHAPAYRALPNTELVAVCTTRQETAEAAAQRMNIPRAYWDVGGMARSPEVDLVSVAVRVSQHYPVVMAALEEGKPVFCEWPLALGSEQAEEMLAAAQEKGVRHALGTQTRYSPGAMYFKDLLDQGYIGRPLLFSMVQFLDANLSLRPSHRWWLAKKEEGGSTLTISCGHATDALRWCLGEVEAVCGAVDVLIKETRFAETGERVPVTAPDSVMFLCWVAGGIMGTVSVSRACWQGSGWLLEVYGTEGKLAASSPSQVQLTPIRVRGARRGEEERELPVPASYSRVSGLTEREPAFNVAQLVSRFTQAIDEGTGFHADFADGAQLHRILEAVERSSQTGQWEVVG